MKYRIYRAAIEAHGLDLSSKPVARTKTLRAALAVAAEPANHGPEGAAIVTPAGRTIYTAEEYDAAYARAAGRREGNSK